MPLRFSLTNKLLQLRGVLLVILTLLSLAGCDRDDAIVSYQAPKVPPPEAASVNSASASASSAPQWTAPQGWKAVPAGAMRFATFAVSDSDPSLVFTVVPLPHQQSIADNVNRWRKELSLPALSEAEASKSVQPISVNGVSVDLIELIGVAANDKRAQSTLAAIVERPDQTWFFKLRGDSGEVALAKPKFDQFIQSLHFSKPGDGSAVAVDKRSSATSDSAIDWAVPPGWQSEGEKPMRLASFHTSADAQSPEVIVSRFPAGAFGDMVANVNRWRNMVGLPPISDLNQAPAQKLAVGSTATDVYDFVGTTPLIKRVRIVLLPSVDGASVLFFRLHGAADAVGAVQPDFDRFVQSVRSESTDTPTNTP